MTLNCAAAEVRKRDACDDPPIISPEALLRRLGSGG